MLVTIYKQLVYIHTSTPYTYIYTHLNDKTAAPIRDANLGKSRSDETSLDQLAVAQHLNSCLLLPPVMISPNTELSTLSGLAVGSGP